MRTLTRWWRTLTVAALVLLAVPIGYVLLQRERGRRELQKVIADLDAADPGWRLEVIEANRASVPDAENATLLLQTIDQQHPRLRNYLSTDELVLMADLPAPCVLNAQQRSILARAFTPVDGLRPALRSLAYRPRGRFALDLSGDLISSLTSGVTPLRSAAGYLRYDSYERLEAGDCDAALLAWRAAWNVQRVVGDEPALISMIVRIALRIIALDSLERMLAHCDFSDVQLAAIQAELAADDRDDLFLIGIRGEPAVSDRLFLAMTNDAKQFRQELVKARTAPTDPIGFALAKPQPKTLSDEISLLLPPPPGLADRLRAQSLRNFTAAIVVARLPEAERRNALEAWFGESQQLPPILRVSVNSIRMTAIAVMREQAIRRAAILAVAAERFRLRTGQLPDQFGPLVQAGLLTAIPLDPSNGQPLGLARRPGAWIAYATGRDSQRHEGYLYTADPDAGDWGFTLWQPHARRQPPVPAPATPAPDSP